MFHESPPGVCANSASATWGSMASTELRNFHSSSVVDMKSSADFGPRAIPPPQESELWAGNH